MDFLPLFVATKNRKIVVVGQGQMADAKCRGVLKTAADVMVFADAPSAEAKGWATQGLIDLRSGLPSAQDFEGVTLFYAAHADDSPHVFKNLWGDVQEGFGPVVARIVDRQFQRRPRGFNVPRSCCRLFGDGDISQQCLGGASFAAYASNDMLQFFGRAPAHENMQTLSGRTVAELCADTLTGPNPENHRSGLHGWLLSLGVSTSSLRT